MWLIHRAHHLACETKQQERQTRIQDLPPEFKQPLTSPDEKILHSSIAIIVNDVQSAKLDPQDVLVAYGKKALEAQERTNCLTEIMISDAREHAKGCNRSGPLAGIPVSLKDTVSVKGWDSCVGFSAGVGKPAKQDSPLIRLLRDAGAVPFVKTTVPTTLLSFECASDVFGRTVNAHKATHSPGGSSGGEAALLASGGSLIGIGTDAAGSVRVPAHYSGLYTVKASAQRFPKGSGAGLLVQEGIPGVYSPMARTMEDLETFWEAVVKMEPWKYDHTCLPIPWRDVQLSSTKPLRWGVIWDDGIVSPSPACKRALHEVVSVLKDRGHDIVAINPPSPYEALKIASQLLMADAGKTVTKPTRPGEHHDLGVQQSMRMFALPNFLRRTYVWYLRYIRRDEIYAGLVEGWCEKSVAEYWALVGRREEYRKKWFEMWNEENLDFVLTVPSALPAVPHGGMKEGFKACGYTFLFNLLDYTAGVLPITRVERGRDALPQSFKARNMVEAGAYKSYNSGDMNGLPVGVQVVGRRLEEEKVLEGMKMIENFLCISK